jgi:spermidine/putrescine transport system substrate-binding protein
MSDDTVHQSASAASLHKVTKWLAACVGIALLGALLASCGGSGSSDTTSSVASVCPKGSTINVLSWQTYHDPPWVEQFEQKTGITVNVQNIGSVAEGVAKVSANPSQYDIVLATSGWFQPLVDNNLLEPVDASRLPNFQKNYHLGFRYQDFTTVNGTVYGVVYTWGTGPLAYVPAGLKGLDLSKYENSSGVLNDWNVLWDPALKGKVIVPDQSVDLVEPSVALALGYKDPFNMTDEQLAAFKEKLFALRPQLKTLTTGDAAQAQAFAGGEAAVGMTGGNYLAGQVKEAGSNLTIVNTLKQGVTAWADNYAITKEGGARSPEELACVYKFMNYTYSLPWQNRLLAQENQPGILNYEQATSAEAKADGVTTSDVNATLIPDTREGNAFYSKLVWLKRYPDVQEMLDIWNEFKLGLE